MSSLADLASIVARLEAVADRFEKLMPGTGAAVKAAVPPPPPSASSLPAAGGSGNAAADEFQDILNKEYKAFVEHAKKYTHPSKVIDQVTAGLESVLSVIKAAPLAKQPDAQELLKVMDPLAKAIAAVEPCAFEAEITPEGDHVKALQESLPLFSFPLFTAKGKDFVDMCNTYNDATQLYLNNVLTKANRSDKEDIKTGYRAYALAYREFMARACTFICKTFAANGLPWKAGGVALADAVKGAAAAPTAAAAAGGVPPPPASSKPAAAADAPAKSSTEDPRASLFKELQQGLSITSKLRHVTKEEKEKYKAAANSGTPIIEEAKVVEPSAPAPARAKPAAPAVKPPSINHQKGSGKLFIENYVDDKESLTYNDLSGNTSMFVGNCRNCNVRVSNKIKAITIDGCQRIHLYVDSLLTTVEIVNSKNVHVHITGRVPTVAIDKSSGCIVALPMDTSIEVPKIVTSNISECNVHMPNPAKVGQEDNDEIDEVIEVPIPEQYEIAIDLAKAKVSAVPVAHA